MTRCRSGRSESGGQIRCPVKPWVHDGFEGDP
jgi:hypothetical protein